MRCHVWPASFEDSILLYKGQLRIHLDDEAIDGHGQVVLLWRPSPHIAYRFVGGTSTEALHLVGNKGQEPTAVELLDLVGDVPIPPKNARIVELADLGTEPRTVTLEGDLPRQEFGKHDAPVTCVVFHLINFIPDDLPEVVEGPDGQSHGRLTLTSGDWQLTIVGPSDVAAPFDELQREGGYAFTHLAELRRSDGRSFTVQNTELVQDVFFHLLGFTRGALVGVGLPVAYDDSDQPVWARWSITVVDRWTNTLNWCEPKLLPELSQIFDGWLRRAADPFWHGVLRRVVRTCLTASTPRPLDTAVAETQMALELLAWAVLVVDGHWLEAGDGDLSAAGQMRLLLRWAGINTTIDERLVALRALAKRKNLVDGPQVLVYVRNRIVHPRRKPKGAPSWPDHEELQESW
nr:hypothetical protein [Actinomycetota bacterium]